MNKLQSKIKRLKEQLKEERVSQLVICYSKIKVVYGLDFCKCS